jgi:hypothetical protein
MSQIILYVIYYTDKFNKGIDKKYKIYKRFKIYESTKF